MKAQLAGVMFLAAVCAAPAWAADSKADLTAIQAVDNGWLKAFSAADGEGLGRLYDENAVLLPPNAPAVMGRAAIRDFLLKEAQGAAKAGMVFSFGDKREGGSSGNLGWSSGTYTVKDKDGKVVETGKFLSVNKKVNGKWMYLRDTWNADTAPPK
ncbi:YybH family protein [Pseudoduganella sp. OTU4001]|uniref:YybH family protein n=1 Tax=Pseudoduganella sp. OTU4001 TaxID=3043854 RepID=UPI00313D0BDB